MLEHDIAFLKGDQAAMDRAVARARERSGGDTWISNKEAYRSRLFRSTAKGKGFDLSARWTRPGRRPSRRGQAYGKPELLCGRPFSETRHKPGRARRLHSIIRITVRWSLALRWPWPSLEMLAALKRSPKMLERRFPEDTVVRFGYLPVLRARIALNQGEACESDRAAAGGRFLMSWAFPPAIRGALPYLYARRGASGSAPGRGSGYRISENSRPPRSRGQRSHRRTRAFATGKSARPRGRQRPKQKRLTGFLHPLERSRPRRTHPETSPR